MHFGPLQQVLLVLWGQIYAPTQRVECSFVAPQQDVLLTYQLVAVELLIVKHHRCGAILDNFCLVHDLLLLQDELQALLQDPDRSFVLLRLSVNSANFECNGVV